jgi:hypothetical protein
MPKITQHKISEVHQSIMMGNVKVNKPEQVTPAPTPKIKNRAENTAAQSPEEKRLKKTFYVTRKQFRAMKMRAATSDKPEEKDPSAIVRAAIDKYFDEPDETKAGE